MFSLWEKSFKVTFLKLFSLRDQELGLAIVLMKFSLSYVLTSQLSLSEHICAPASVLPLCNAKMHLYMCVYAIHIYIYGYIYSFHNLQGKKGRLTTLHLSGVGLLYTQKFCCLFIYFLKTSVLETHFKTKSIF